MPRLCHRCSATAAAELNALKKQRTYLVFEFKLMGGVVLENVYKLKGS